MCILIQIWYIYTCKYVEGILVYHFGTLLMGAQVIHTTTIDIYLQQATPAQWFPFNGSTVIRAHKIIQNGLPHICANIYIHYIFILYTYIVYVYIYLYMQCIRTFVYQYIQYLIPPSVCATWTTRRHVAIIKSPPRFWAAFILAESRVESGKTGTPASCTCQKSRLSWFKYLYVYITYSNIYTYIQIIYYKHTYDNIYIYI